MPGIEVRHRVSIAALSAVWFREQLHQPFRCVTIKTSGDISLAFSSPPSLWNTFTSMEIKKWALFYIFLVSSHYVGTAVAQYKCTPRPKMQETVNRCMQRARNRMQDSVPLESQTVNNSVQLDNGRVSGLKNMKVHPVTCTCFPEFVRIFIRISFLDITVTFLVTLLDGLLGGLLGNLGRTLARLVGQVVNLLVNLLALEITVEIAVDQRFTPGTRARVVSYRVTRITQISVLNINLTDLLVGLLGDLLTPIVETLLINLLDRQVRAIITQELEKETFTPDMYDCEGGQPMPQPMPQPY